MLCDDGGGKKMKAILGENEGHSWSTTALLGAPVGAPPQKKILPRVHFPYRLMGAV